MCIAIVKPTDIALPDKDRLKICFDNNPHGIGFGYGSRTDKDYHFVDKFDDFENRLNSSLEKALDLLNKKNSIRFQDRGVLYTINIKDILYITKDSFERKSIIKTDYTEFKVNKSLAEIVDMLDDRFIQTHRACYINSDRKVKVDKIKRLITFDTGEVIDLLSEKYRKELV